jgi:hypothetical protein
MIASSSGCAVDRKWREMSHTGKGDDLTRSVMEDSPLRDPLAGRWEGKWVSEQTGHSGRLRAIVTRVDGDTYRINYDAHFMGILRFTHAMNVAATREGETIKFHGEEDLGGMAGGVYRYDGTCNGREFTSTYDAKDDHGRFEMARPKE